MTVSIHRLMSVPENSRDRSWLHQMLQWAVELELSTIPPYLCALWSIKIDPDADISPVYWSLLAIVREEMLHLGLACNLLNTLDCGPPRLMNRIPRYPGRLPGGVRPSVRLSLQGLSMPVIARVFMEIEYPEARSIDIYRGRGFNSIGAFYAAILDRFENHPSLIQGANQVDYANGNIHVFPIGNINDVRNAVKIIREQGEGTSQSPFPSGASTPAHYFRFGEIYHQRKIIQHGADWDYLGDPVEYPGVLPVPEVPPRGYKHPKLRAFDRLFTEMMQVLQDAFTAANVNVLQSAVDKMKEMKQLGREIMSMPLPFGGGNYCPNFRRIRSR